MGDELAVAILWANVGLAFLSTAMAYVLYFNILESASVTIYRIAGRKLILLW